MTLGIAIAGLIILGVTLSSTLRMPESTYLSKAAVDEIKNGTARYYGYQMAENTNRLLSEEEDVLVMPFGVNPDCLYPYDAEDWIMGTKLFYRKNSVTYESEPYHFTR